LTNAVGRSLFVVPVEGVRMRRIGLVVNPIAGMGGRVGLKGTDGKVEAARERGAEPRAPERATDALVALRERAEDVDLLAAGGVMGADEARDAGFDPTVVTDPGAETTAEDTREAVRASLDAGVDLVLFAGGDGTAVDVAAALDDAGDDTPMLGVPAGVKVYSSVFGVTPEDAGRIAATFDAVADREINDIDEDAYRGGEVETDLEAVRPVPVADDLQSSKQLGGGSVESLAAGFAADVDPDATYVLGPGSTVGATKAELGIDGSPLGVDVWRDGEMLARDAAADEILDALGDRNVIVVSPIGGQGFIFGRGNDQISPAVIERSEVEVVASRAKLDGVGVLRVDTDDEGVDESLRGWRKVRVGRFERRMMQVV
jgi:predicted polyphosphate/ATP-dependent NAD kinase